MELQQLMYFKVTAEHENLSRAAEKLYISQPALTKTIQRLEDDLGVKLFDRNGKSIRLNRSGRIVLSYTTDILQDLASMRHLLQQETVTEGLTILTDLPNILRYVLPSFKKENELIPTNVQYIEALCSAHELLEAGACDIIITSQPDTSPGLENIHLLSDPLVLFVPEGHPLLDKGWATFQDLSDMRLVEPQSAVGTRSWRIVREYINRHQVNTSFIQTVDIGSQEYLMKLTDYSTISSAMTSLFWKPPNRYAIPLRGQDTKIDYYASYLEKTSNTLNDNFIRWMKNWFEWVQKMCHSML